MARRRPRDTRQYAENETSNTTRPARSPEPGASCLLGRSSPGSPSLSSSTAVRRQVGWRQGSAYGANVQFITELLFATSPCGEAPFADANGLDPVLPDRLHADRIPVVRDDVAALREPPQLAED